MKIAQAGKKSKLKKEKNPFVYKERKERVFKPTKASPPQFYTSTRTGYSWCDSCDGNRVNVLNGTTLTCVAGHNITLPKSGIVQELKVESQDNVGLKLLMI